ncbi:MAG: hypothetical protein GC158_07795 [Cyanobacteria bacterium RI_101]|nr:hypothetical protein [Cyanobacteria bacterium RI_101]
MLLFVICFNLALAALNCYLAAQLWLGRRRLQRLARRLAKLERCSRRILGAAPGRLYRFKSAAQTGRLSSRQLRRRWQILLFLGQIPWFRVWLWLRSAR